MSDYDTAHKQTDIFEFRAKSQDILIIGDSEVASHLVLFDVDGTDDHKNLCLISQLKQHLELTVRLKTGENSACVVVIEKLTSEFEVKFVSELSYSLLDLFGLYLKILLIVKSRFHTECKDNFSSPSLQEEIAKNSCYFQMGGGIFAT